MKNKIDTELLSWEGGKIEGFFGKELLSLHNGSVKLIRIKSSSSYPEHIHPNKTEYAFVFEGNPEFIIDNELYYGQPNDFFIFPAGMKHAINNPDNNVCLLLIGAIKQIK